MKEKIMSSAAIKDYNTEAAKNAIKNNPKLAGGTSPEEQGQRNADAVELLRKRLAELKANAASDKK
jgi:hypothetical protein